MALTAHSRSLAAAAQQASSITLHNAAGSGKITCNTKKEVAMAEAVLINQDSRTCVSDGFSNHVGSGQYPVPPESRCLICRQAVAVSELHLLATYLQQMQPINATSDAAVQHMQQLQWVQCLSRYQQGIKQGVPPQTSASKQ